MAIWLTVVHLSPLLLLPVLQFPFWLNLLLPALVFYSLLDSWRRQVRRSHPDAVRRVVWKDTQHCQLTLTSGRQLDVGLASQAFILPWLVVLHFRTPDRRFRYLPVLSDMLDEDVFRRLRARLRIAIDAGAT
ncbi:MAG: protein YgfX [Gammaproteobacteria bacterium]